MDKDQLFERRFQAWLKFIQKPEIMTSSRTEDYVDNESYKMIIELGEDILPNLIEKIREGYFFLNRAVSEITKVKTEDVIPIGTNPFSEQEVSKYWINWWEENKSYYLPKNKDDGSKGVSEIGSFSIVQGQDKSYAEISKLLKEAKNTIYILSPMYDLRLMHSTSIPDDIKKAKERDVPVFLIVESDEMDVKDVMKMNATEVRISQFRSKSRLIVEEKAKLIMLSNVSLNLTDPHYEKDASMVTDQYEMISNMFSLCSHLWKKAKPLTVNSYSKQER